MSDEQEPLHPLERRRREAANQPPAELPPPPPPVPFSERLRLIRRMWSMWVLIAVNVAVFVLGGLDQDSIIARSRESGLNAALVLQSGEYTRLVTAMFLHGSIFHLGINMLSLHNIGTWVIGLFGHRRFWIIYLLSGLGGTVMGVLLSSPRVYSVGASGAIMGLIGALITFFYRHTDLLNSTLREVRRSLVTAALLTLGIGLIPGSIIDNWGHIGGFLMGAALGYGITPYYQRFTQPHPVTGQPMQVARDTAKPSAQNAFALQAGAVLIIIILFARLIRSF